jgi:small subunit ribosomal protein S16
MAVSIRLRREGTKNTPFYRIAVADSRSPRDGRFIELLGHYDPKQAGQNFTLDLPRAEYWIKNGARPSDTVLSLIKKARRSAAPAEA